MDKSKRKRVPVRTGQLVAIPLQDGTWGLGHVAFFEYRSIKCALYACRAGSPEQLAGVVDEAFRTRPVALRELTSDEIRDGDWPVIGERPPEYPAKWLDMRGYSYTASMARSFLNAYHGLVPWDGMAAEPRLYEFLLLPGVPIPPSARYKRDFAASSDPASPPHEGGQAVEVTEGPAEVHIQTVYPGLGLPSVELLRRRQQLERELESRGAGEVTDAGVGEGVMDVHLETQDVRAAMIVVKAIINELGLGEDSIVETHPLEDDGEDDG